MLNSRKFCLACSPWGRGNKRNLSDPDVMCLDRTCFKCGKKYRYGGKYNSKGHRRNICNACRAVLYTARKKKRAIEYLGGRCSRCGYDKSPNALCFHHRNPEIKNDIISKMYALAWDRLRLEIDKCDLLCLNCHAEIHAELWNDRPYSRGQFVDQLDES